MAEKQTEGMQHKTLTSYVYETICYRINTGILGPGDVISERKLSTDLNVSRTPIREATKVLLEEGKLETKADKSVVVSPISMDNIEEICSLYMSLENLMVFHTLEKISEEDISHLEEVSEKTADLIKEGNLKEAAAINFDPMLWEMSGMTNSIQYARLLPQLWKYPCIQPFVDKEKKEQNILEHCTMVQMLKKNQFESFKELFDHHIHASVAYSLEAYEEYLEQHGLGKQVSLAV